MRGFAVMPRNPSASDKYVHLHISAEYEGSFLSQVLPTGKGRATAFGIPALGCSYGSMQTAPVVQEPKDHGEDGSWGKRLPKLCSSRVCQATASPRPCFESFPQPLGWGVITPHVPPPVLGISSNSLLFLKTSGMESWEQWERSSYKNRSCSPWGQMEETGEA